MLLHLLLLLLLLLQWQPTAAPSVGRRGSTPVLHMFADQSHRSDFQFLSRNAFYVRKGHAVPSVLLDLSHDWPESINEAKAAIQLLQQVRAVMLPEDPGHLRDFARLAGPLTGAARSRLFLGVRIEHTRRRQFGRRRFLSILQSLGVQRLDLLLLQAPECTHSARDRIACGSAAKVAGRALRFTWRNLLTLVHKHRVTHLGIENFSPKVIAVLHAASSEKCAAAAAAAGAAAPNDDALPKSCRIYFKKSNNKDKQQNKAAKKNSQPPPPSAPLSPPTSVPIIPNPYTPTAAASRHNVLSVVVTQHSPQHPRGQLRKWCRKHGVAVLSDTVAGGREHARAVLTDRGLVEAAKRVGFSPLAAVADWTLRQRVGLVLSFEELRDALQVLRASPPAVAPAASPDADNAEHLLAIHHFRRKLPNFRDEL